MATPTITDKRCAVAPRQLLRLVEVEYEKVFPHVPPGEAFFEHLERVDLKVTERLKQRPITKAEIDGIVREAFKALRRTIRAEAKKVEQPRFQEQVHIDSGRTKMIPYVD